MNKKSLTKGEEIKIFFVNFVLPKNIPKSVVVLVVDDDVIDLKSMYF